MRRDRMRNEVDEATMWGADPVAAFEASRRHEVKPEVPSEDSVTMKAHRKMVKDFGKLITKVVRRSVDASNRHALSDMLDVRVNPFPKWGEFFRDQMTPRSVQMIKWLGDALKEWAWGESPVRLALAMGGVAAEAAPERARCPWI